MNNSTDLNNLIDIRKNRTTFVLLKNFLVSALFLFKIIKLKKREFIIILSLLFNISLLITIFDIFVIVNNLVMLVDDYQQRLVINQRLITNRFLILRAFIFRIKRKVSVVRKSRF